MRRVMFVFLLLAAAWLLGGCAEGQQVENRAYVIAMGVDRAESGDLEITVQIPKIAGGQDSQEGGSSASSSGNYLPLSVTAESYEYALELLNWAVPRDLNLSQIKLIVLSRELAEEGSCKDLIRSIANTEKLFAAARVAVCEGTAKEFVTALSPMLGTRLSTDIDATFDHYLELGIVPDATLANLEFLTHSVYSDPMTGYAVLEKKQEAKEASVLGGSIEQISKSAESDIQTRYLGAAVFADGYFRGTLDGDQAILVNAINNSLDSFRYICGGESMEFSPIGKCRVTVDTKAEPAQIHIALALSISDQDEIPPENVIRETLEADMRSVISICQQMSADPFGFADKAAGSFLTMQDWIQYDWRSRFPEAEIDIQLDFSHPDA